jgi:hypothetical protein
MMHPTDFMLCCHERYSGPGRTDMKHEFNKASLTRSIEYGITISFLPSRLERMARTSKWMNAFEVDDVNFNTQPECVDIASLNIGSASGPIIPKEKEHSISMTLWSLELHMLSLYIVVTPVMGISFFLIDRFSS